MAGKDFGLYLIDLGDLVYFKLAFQYADAGKKGIHYMSRVGRT